MSTPKLPRHRLIHHNFKILKTYSLTNTSINIQSTFYIYNNLLVKCCRFAPLRLRNTEESAVGQSIILYIVFCLHWFVSKSIVNRLYLYFQHCFCLASGSLFSQFHIHFRYNVSERIIIHFLHRSMFSCLYFPLCEVLTDQFAFSFASSFTLFML